LNNDVKAKILFEISRIDKLLDGGKPLLDLCKLKIPDFIEISAVALLLHSFYNGIENVLVLIFKNYNEKLPNGIKWHIELLDRAFVSNGNRKAIFQNEVQESMEEYLKFRHFIRHAYGFQLEWSRMENLVKQIESMWKVLKESLNQFMENSGADG
jgi:hypothetical protein